MKMDDPQVQNELIFSLGESTKTGEKLRRRTMKQVTDEEQRKGGGGVCGVAQKQRRGDR